MLKLQLEVGQLRSIVKSQADELSYWRSWRYDEVHAGAGWQTWGAEAEAEGGVTDGYLVEQVLDNLLPRVRPERWEIFPDKSPMDTLAEMIGMDGEYDQQEDEGYLKVDGYKQAEVKYDQMEGDHNEDKVGCDHEDEHAPEKDKCGYDCEAEDEQVQHEKDECVDNVPLARKTLCS